MDLPASVAALGEQLGGAGKVVPDPALFHEADVFAAERERIFARPWMAVDHATRLDEDGRYFRFDAAARSVVVTRDGSGRLHALRNVCIHAGYPVCDAEEGSAERLICPYHGWEFALDGELLEPAFASRTDRSRLRMTSYRVCVRDGLILVDASGGPPSSEEIAGPIPAWVSDGKVTRRASYSTTWNWKFVLHFLQHHPELSFDEPSNGDDDGCVEFGPLSWMMVRSDQVALFRVIPKFAERTDFQLIRMAVPEAPERSVSEEVVDPVADALRNAGDAGAANWSSRLDPGFFAWYWPLMSAS
jgi:phenylpropionate dioxygenase-like ring-hydroxylating dioxygenase large terminal subunit